METKTGWRLVHLALFVLLFIQAQFMNRGSGKGILVFTSILSVCSELLFSPLCPFPFQDDCPCFHQVLLASIWFISPIAIVLQHTGDASEWRLIIGVVLTSLAAIIVALVRLFHAQAQTSPPIQAPGLRHESSLPSEMDSGDAYSLMIDRSEETKSSV